MRRRSRGFLQGVLAVVAAAVATTAMAADLPVPAPAAPAYFPPPARYDWTGIYIGGNVGGGWANDVIDPTTTTLLQPAGAQTKDTLTGFLFGAQAGFNIEFSPVVIGFEGTWNKATLTGEQSTPSPLIGGGFSELTNDEIPWFATAAGRIGYAANDLLFYAKGGGAWARTEYTQSVTAGPVFTQQTLTDRRTGFLVGGGLEYGLTENFSIKIEYDYIGFGTKDYTFNNLGYTATPGAPPPVVITPLGPFPVSIKSSLQMATVGINYRFNWAGGGPLVAK